MSRASDVSVGAYVFAQDLAQSSTSRKRAWSPGWHVWVLRHRREASSARAPMLTHDPGLPREGALTRHRPDRVEVDVDPAFDVVAIAMWCSLRVGRVRELREEHLCEGLEVDLEFRRGRLPVMKVRVGDAAVGDPQRDPRAGTFVLAPQELPDRVPGGVLMREQAQA